MNKTWIALTACVCITGCLSVPSTIRGTVVDATMNTVTLKTNENQTYVFSTVETDKTQLNGLVLGKTVSAAFRGAYHSGQELLKLSDYPLPVDLFNDAMVFIPADSSDGLLYLLDEKEKSTLQLYDAAGKLHATLTRSSTAEASAFWHAPSLGLKLQNEKGILTLRQNGKPVYAESTSFADSSLGELTEEHFTGVLPAADCEGIRYDLRIKHRAFSGDGLFLLTLTYLNAQGDRDISYSYLGRRFTLRGSADDENDIVWQCQTDDRAFAPAFLYEPEDQTLTLLTKEHRKIQSQLNYTLIKVR